VVKSLARIATELGKRTVAEFVEDDATLELLREYGVDFAQGFGIGRPQPVSEWLGTRPTPRPALTTLA
jgi:Amt family ammonium transporter